MSVETAYQYLFEGALIWLGILLLIMLLRAIIGPRVTDRILSINMIGTMVSCSICLLSSVLDEYYLIDVALLYAMISFVSVLILASTYIARNPSRGKYDREVSTEVMKEKRWMNAMYAKMEREEKEAEGEEE